MFEYSKGVLSYPEAMIIEFINPLFPLTSFFRLRCCYLHLVFQVHQGRIKEKDYRRYYYGNSANIEERSYPDGV